MRFLIRLAVSVCICAPLLAQAITVQLPKSGLLASELAVIVNDQDPLSVEIGEYYRLRRAIPAENVIHISFEPGKPTMHPGEFAVLKTLVDAKTPIHVQAYLLTWAAPYRVGCMSISSALAFGFNTKFCATGCKPTSKNPYAGSSSKAPFVDYGIRPTMLLAATNLSEAKLLIDRGVTADGNAWLNRGSAYLVETPDKARSVRKVYFQTVKKSYSSLLPVYIDQARSIRNKSDLMFYFTGDKFVEDLDSNHYLAGAMADHLTSTGGQLIKNKQQMSAMRWLEAGATGSYGTVVEPCNLLGKFPNPVIAIGKYLQGATLIEAYWKSVEMPGQGVFIGEPLARPYSGYRLQASHGGLILTPLLDPGNYQLLRADNPGGPYHLLRSNIVITDKLRSIALPQPYSEFYGIKQQLD
jgi:uncharacterized protein (TIGR03790 family)